MGFGKALGVTLLGGAALAVLGNLFDGDKKLIRNVYIVICDIKYGGINLTQESRELVDELRRTKIIGNKKFDHWALQVGEGDDARFFEIMSYNIFTKQMKLQPTRWGPSQLSKVTERKPVGKTSRSDEEIAKICNDVIQAKPKYHLLVNNCQDFVQAALKEILDVKDSMSDIEEKALATILSVLILGPIVGPGAVLPLTENY